MDSALASQTLREVELWVAAAKSDYSSDPFLGRYGSTLILVCYGYGEYHFETVRLVQ